MIHREPGQARKGAATAVDSCAGMWLVELSPVISNSYLLYLLQAYHLIASDHLRLNQYSAYLWFLLARVAASKHVGKIWLNADCLNSIFCDVRHLGTVCRSGRLVFLLDNP